MNVNVRAMFQLISMAVPFLKDSHGTVVNVSASAGITPEPGALVFSVSKAMVNMLTKCAALELGSFGIRVNAVAPGFVESPARLTPGEVSMGMSEGDFNAAKAKVAAATPLNAQVSAIWDYERVGL
jgi:NAD(P)-dependent dehydrogenase (short-subunit alcohol dehydrogenase family)